MKEFLNVLAEGETLTQAQAEAAMHRLMQGDFSPEQAGAFLLGLRARGETLPELIGFTKVMRDYAVKVTLEDEHAIDLCGTGGDAKGTFNVSTTAAFVCAGAGVTVAKHGNRSVSSTCGSADVLEALGVQVDLGKEGVEHCLRTAGIAFLFAPYFHPAMRHIGPVRGALGVRTFFNILGPLTNPAGVRRQLIGTFSADIAQLMANILSELDAMHILTVHAEDGLDEISIGGPTAAFEYRQDNGSGTPGKPQVHRITPEAHGMGRVPLQELKGGDAVTNARLLQAVLDGDPGPHRDIVLLNAAFALHTSGRFNSVAASLEAARESIDGGHAKAKLAALVDASQNAPAATA